MEKDEFHDKIIKIFGKAAAFYLRKYEEDSDDAELLIQYLKDVLLLDAAEFLALHKTYGSFRPKLITRPKKDFYRRTKKIK